MNQLEMLARDRILQRSQHQDRSGIRRSARLIAQEIRASRRHRQQRGPALWGVPRHNRTS
ncbi:MAG: hypothetical protein JWP82_2923 [Humibacillus sp.]|nr:hypothetical protein [Humibacillus sp.]